MSISANIILSAMRAVKKTGIIKGPGMDADKNTPESIDEVIQGRFMFLVNLIHFPIIGLGCGSSFYCLIVLICRNFKVDTPVITGIISSVGRVIYSFDMVVDTGVKILKVMF